MFSFTFLHPFLKDNLNLKSLWHILHLSRSLNDKHKHNSTYLNNLFFCLNAISPIFWQNLHWVRAQPSHSPPAWHTSHSVLEWTQYIDASHRFMAIFVPRLILNYKQFVERSFIHSKSTSACCCFFTLRGQGFRNWFQTPKLLLTKCWYSRRKGHGHERYLYLQEF